MADIFHFEIDGPEEQEQVIKDAMRYGFACLKPKSVCCPYCSELLTEPKDGKRWKRSRRRTLPARAMPVFRKQTV